MRLPQLRITVNARCGRACFYCRPSGEAIATNAGMALDLETVIRVCSVFSRFGGKAVKLTGGDPALWEPLVPCVRRIKQTSALAVEVISRHPRIGKLAAGLRNANTDVINLSIDTLDRETHHQITGVDDLPDVLKAAAICGSSGIPCKINTVVMRGINDGEIDRIMEFCEGIGARTLKLLDLIGDLEDGSETYALRLRRLKGLSPRDLYLPMELIIDSLRVKATSSRSVTQGGLGHPMLRLLMPSGLEILVKDHRAGAWYGSICTDCRHYPCHDALMALRLTADSRLQFCLLRTDVAIDLKPLLADGGDAIERAMANALSVYEGAGFIRQEALV